MQRSYYTNPRIISPGVLPGKANPGERLRPVFCTALETGKEGPIKRHCQAGNT